MNVQIGKTVEFRDSDGKVCAIYHFDDPFKSYFGVLLTPGGKNVVAPRPADHPHHKGLQFGLCASDVNFWEEDEGQEPEQHKLPVGRQRNKQIVLLPADAGVGFLQHLQWETDKACTFHETRKITVEKISGAYRWRWHTTLVATRDRVTLIPSVWPGPGYCGLGLRLARDLFEHGTVTPAGVRSGSEPLQVAYHGRQATVRFGQDASQHDALFISSYAAQPGFAFISLGPANLHPRQLELGQRIECSYSVEVADG